MKEMKHFLDHKGYLFQRDGHKFNYIDSNFLTTNCIFQKAVLGDIRWYDGRAMQLIAVEAKHDYRDSEGVIRRYHSNFDKILGANPEETRRYTDPNHVSRDNSMGYLMMCGYFGYKSTVRSFMYHTLTRGSFFQNTHTVKGEKKALADFCGPEQWAVLVRAGFPKWVLLLFYPVLLVLDIFYFLSYTWHVAQSYYDSTHTSTALHMLSGVLLCKETVQTPFSFAAEKIFINLRKQVEGFEDEEPIVSALKYYSRQTYDPPLEQLGKRVIKHLRRK